jgi:hypothetical protein
VSDQFEEAIDRDTRAMERLADSFEMIAKLMAQFFDKMYPPSHEPRDVTLTRLPDTIDRIKEDQGASEESTEEWLDLGPREREVIERAKASEGNGQSGTDKKASRPRPIKSQS